jgi:dTDP-4-dehydrorhamnose 3,5-epimerase
MLRSDSSLYSGFGEIYFSMVNHGAIKAWKRHKKMTQRFAVPVGSIQLVLFDNSSNGEGCGIVEEYILGRPDNYYLITIPPLIWYGFRGISEKPACLANCSDMPHDPGESEQVDISYDFVPYNWT